MAVDSGFVVLIGSDGLGRGDEDLGRHLMSKFLHELGGQRSLPERIILINHGVKLVVEGSPVLEQMRHLEQAGVVIAACGTCLSRLELIDRVAVGSKSDMRTTVTALSEANRVVSV
jgi:selenium metabolism protein YedF